MSDQPYMPTTWEVAPSITRNPYETEEDRHVDQ